ncbi:M4 family peptidase [Nocardioides marmoriginsengisoli]|uniref:Neutral metalloproteinase n=1 Tax=Nocardioides marmoriginsengisoli TaxID=661483 RepID=A0A3N0CNL8_9ACTN|nr:M4 family metallopeptidase [Nocardioides marmoriginsengisoli]RNL65067.1 M4 family peptidase [Nocardioides marmoriginsengisoli]
MRTPARLLTTLTAVLAATTASGLISAAPVVGADKDTKAAAAIAAAKAHASTSRFGAGQALTATDTITDRDGSTHVRLHRSYRGLEVVGGDLVVHQDRTGRWEGSSQTLRSDLKLSADAVLAPSAAESKAAAPNKVNRRISGDEPESATLVVDATGTAPRLAWRVQSGGVQADGTPSRVQTYVDARTGALIRAEQEIQTADGSGQSLYAGNVPLRLTQSGSSYQLKDPTRGNTYTTDLNGATDGALCTLLGLGCKAGTLFTSTDTSFGNGSTSSRESAAVDAQYGTNVTWDFYQAAFGRNGIFGTGAGSYNRVHYGNKYVNAFWDGEKMTYGDGDGVNYGPLTSLDVAGHEMSHGVTENTAGLTYSGESGGLNEATSDIFGTMVEFFAANPADPGDYLIGERFDLKNHVGLRRMDNPASDGNSVNCWTSSVKNLDVHYSSGVGNHFFYLLAEGSAPKSFGGVAHSSPTCNGSSVAGIGRDAAAQIWYRALTVYMTSSTNYAGARTATLNAARDLYGSGSTQYNAVATAWSAVSVG